MRILIALQLTVVASFALQGCSSNVFDELQDLCEKQARLIVHNEEVWQEFIEAGDRRFEERAKEYPNTGRAFIEYVEGFDRQYGAELRDRPHTIEGKIVRNDTIIVHEGRWIAQFVNFFAHRQGTASSIMQDCIGNYPNSYEAGRKE